MGIAFVIEIILVILIGIVSILIMRQIMLDWNTFKRSLSGVSGGRTGGRTGGRSGGKRGDGGIFGGGNKATRSPITS